MKILLVDVDNLYIMKNKPNIELFKSRMELIKKVSKKIIYFGNIATQHFLSQNNIKLPNFTVSVIEKDTSDHKIINSLSKYNKKYEVYIVTNDKILMKLAAFINREPLRFLYFSSNNDLNDIEMDTSCFKDDDQLKKFILSYNLYKTRY
jgi:hypothetical protein